MWKNPPYGDASITYRPTDGVALELLALGLVALDIRKTGDAVPLQAPMQRRPG